MLRADGLYDSDAGWLRHVPCIIRIREADRTKLIRRGKLRGIPAATHGFHKVYSGSHAALQKSHRRLLIGKGNGLRCNDVQVGISPRFVTVGFERRETIGRR